ncbi:MAG: rod shape-determining protein MreC [Bacteroidia bacterium]|nr:rod shape-determining protein MreC [Bacteroidia bacterium]MDW8157316.1 rod shape-determining protein MreC [Bacteroidia bacterium]
MERLLVLIYNYRNVILFLILEFLALWLLVNFNKNQNKVFQDFILSVTGVIQSWNARWITYFNLGDQNARLLKENIWLRTQLIHLQSQLNQLRHYQSDSLKFLYRKKFAPSDSASFDYIPCRVIYNSNNSNYNYLILNIGRKHGVEEDYGVVSNGGIVGIVTKVSENYSLAMSLLNKNFKLNAQITSNNVRTLFQWKGGDVKYGSLSYVPLHYKISVGDTVVSSSYSSIFPEGYIIGTIHSFADNQADGFYNIKVKLSSDFRKLDYAYLVRHKRKNEIDSLLSQVAQ